MDWSAVFRRIAEICGNPGYATIIGAIIAAITTIWVAIYQVRKGKERKKPKPVEIPPDRTEPLQTDPFGLKDIDSIPFNSKEYSVKIALIYEITKNPDTVAEVLYDEGDSKDGPHRR